MPQWASQVLENRIVEHDRLLLHERDGAAEGRPADLLRRAAVEADFAGRRIVRCVTSRVTLRENPPIDRLLARRDPTRMAGGYAIRRKNDPLIERIDGSITNKSALTAKQKRDRGRLQIKIDVAECPIVRQVAEQIAAENSTSISQASAWLLAAGAIHYLRDQPEIPTLPSRSPRFQLAVDLGPISKQLENLTEGSGVSD